MRLLLPALPANPSSHGVCVQLPSLAFGATPNPHARERDASSDVQSSPHGASFLTAPGFFSPSVLCIHTHTLPKHNTPLLPPTATLTFPHPPPTPECTPCFLPALVLLLLFATQPWLRRGLYPVIALCASIFAQFTGCQPSLQNM
ncbi:hypothetical protein ABPG75_007108 [Micractinium tetrahymenae]